MRTLLFLLFSIGTFAYSTRTEQAGGVSVASFQLKDNSCVNLSEFVSSVELVPLETTEACLIGTLAQLVEHNGYYYIGSAGMVTEQVMVFDANGRFLYKLDKRGMGPDEFYDKYGISDEDLYKILKAMYGYDAGDLGADDLNAGINNVKSELDSKYYVTLASDNAEDLFNEIIGLKEDFGKLRVNNDDAVGDEKARYMVQDQRDTQDLYPLLDATDIAALIEGSGKLNMASISILTDTGITSSTIEKVGDKDRIVFEVTGRFNSEADGASDAKMYAPLFPEKMSVIVTITEEVTNTGADEAKELATTYNLNGIEDDLMTKTMFFVARLSGKNDMTKESVEEDISKQINEAFDSLTSDGAVTLDIDGENDGNVRLGNVFEVATAAIWEEKDGTISSERPDDDLFRRTIKALWAGLDGYNQANGENIMKLGYTSAIAPFNVNIATYSADTRISDAFIGSQMASSENMGNITGALGITNKEAVSVYQTYIIPGSGTPASPETGYSEKERYDEINTYFAETGLISRKGDMLFTLKLAKEALNGVMNPEGESMSISKDMQHFVPDFMYVSAGITISEGGLNDVRVVINRLKEDEQDTLQKMLRRFGVDIAGLFGGEDKTLANQIAETPIVKLTNDDVGADVLPEDVTVTVGDLFEYAGGTANGTRFVSAITDDLDGQDGSTNAEYESSYIYWDYKGDYSGCDDFSKFESGTAPTVYNVGLGYLYYSIDLSSYVPGN